VTHLIKMKTSIIRAFNLILNPTEELLNILGTTAKMSLSSSLIALIIGVLIGIWLGNTRSKLKSGLIVINRTLVGMPPVVCGLILYILFSGVGPFRHLQWMYTVQLMVLAQVLLITPIVISTMETNISEVSGPINETCSGLGLSKGKKLKLVLNESVYYVFSAYLMAFSRAIAEVGAVAMVGGAIAWKTNVMTTAIMMYSNRGDFTLGIALGIILLILSFIVNIAVTLIQRRLTR